jgi:hypothetical protein
MQLNLGVFADECRVCEALINLCVNQQHECAVPAAEVGKEITKSGSHLMHDPRERSAAPAQYKRALFVTAVLYVARVRAGTCVLQGHCVLLVAALSLTHLVWLGCV